MKHIHALILSLLTAICISAQTRPRGPMTDFYHNRANNMQLPLAERLDSYDSLIALHPGTTSLLLDKIRTLNDYLKTDITAPLLDSLRARSDNLSVADRCRVLIESARVSSLTSDFSSTYYLASELLNMEKPDSLRFNDVWALITLSSVSFEVNDYEYADKYLDRALETIDKVKWTDERRRLNRIATIHGQRATYLIDRKMYNEAYNEITRLLDLDVDSVTMAGAYLVLGQIYEGMGKKDIAIQYYRRSLDMPCPSINKHAALLSLVQRLTEEGRPQEALSLLDSYPEILERGSLAQNNISALPIRGAVEAALGNYKEAYDLMLRGWMFRDSVVINQKKYQAINSKRQIALLDEAREDGRLKNRYLVFSIILLAVVAVLLAVIAWMEKDRRKARETALKCAEQARTIELQQQSLERETLKTADISNTYTAMRDTVAQISETLESDSSPAAKVEALKRAIRQQGVSERLLLADRRLREITDPLLLTTLHTRYPSLTKAEVEICMFMRQGYTSKQIADMTNRSRRTVDVIKYHVRRKMEIPEGVPTPDFLAGLLGQ